MKMTAAEFNSRNYDASKIDGDWRLKECTKECWITVALISVLIVILLVIKYTIGAGDPREFTYLFGIPLWASLSYIVIIVGMITAAVITRKLFKNFSLEDEP